METIFDLTCVLSPGICLQGLKKASDNFTSYNRYIQSGQLDFVNTVMNLICAISVY